MSDFARTAIYLMIAAGSVYGVHITQSLPSDPKPELFSDQGELFFPEFTDISQATSLEVWDFDEDRGGLVPFKIEFSGGVWRIPSKNGYPADGEERLAKTAASLLGIKRTVFRSNVERDHADFRVVDPKAEADKPLQGRGRRVTLSDAGGKVIFDLIIGREAAGDDDAVEGKDGLVWVRRPGEKKIYGTKLELDLSVEFDEWIETDLLKLDIASITSVTNDAYKVDEAMLRQGMIRIEPGEKTLVGQVADGEWTVAGQSASEQASMAAIDSMTETLKALTIKDVLPRKDARLEQAGFFATQQGVYSNEGELRVDVNTGVTYILRFGEAVPAPEGEDGLRRFVVIEAKENHPALGAKANDAEAKTKATKLVAELNQRFGEWYYILAADDFDNLRPARKLLVEPKEESEDDGALEHGPGDGHDHGGPMGPTLPDGPPFGPTLPDAPKDDGPPPAEDKPGELPPAGVVPDGPAPVEDKPADEPPVEDKPADEPPVEDKPAVEPPVEDKPAVQPPVEDKPAVEPPVEDKPADEPPVEDKPAVEPPVEDKPAVEPPVEDKPAEQPPVEDKPAVEPPVEDKPTEDPPTEDPPAEDPPADDPPADDPPADDPPADDPPADDPPADDPPADDPPADDPPADDPPADDPPADDPPADDPPADDPPADDPPADDPK